MNKENNDTKAGKSTNYLRKILSNEMSFTEFEKEKSTLVKHNKTTKDCELELKKDFDDTEYQVLGDHSYYEHVKLVNEEEKISPDLNEMMVNQAMGENVCIFCFEILISKLFTRLCILYLLIEPVSIFKSES